jgi:hypothetical protein
LVGLVLPQLRFLHGPDVVLSLFMQACAVPIVFIMRLQGRRHDFTVGRASNQRVLSEEVGCHGCQPQTVLCTLATFFYCSHVGILEFTRRYFQQGMQLGTADRSSIFMVGVVTFASSAQVTPRNIKLMAKLVVPSPSYYFVPWGG